jgi:hypothetical protein
MNKMSICSLIYGIPIRPWPVKAVFSGLFKKTVYSAVYEEFVSPAVIFAGYIGVNPEHEQDA